jgi:hypothetical protein
MPDVSTTLSGYLRNFSLWCRQGFADKLSGSGAQPGLILQGYDAAAGVNPSIYMLEVSQAGVAALAPMALGGGAKGAPVPIASRKGVTDGSSAAAGMIGEYVTAPGSTIAITNNVATNVVTMPLTAGDWDVEGLIQFGFASGTYASAVVCGVSTVSATFPSPVQPGRSQLNVSPASLSICGLPTGMMRASLAAAGPVYLVGLAVFSSTATAQGFLRARRAG